MRSLIQQSAITMMLYLKIKNKYLSSMHIYLKIFHMEVLFMDNWINLIANAGFPIAVATYLLVRFENKIDALSQSINNLSNVVMAKGISKGENELV